MFCVCFCYNFHWFYKKKFFYHYILVHCFRRNIEIMIIWENSLFFLHNVALSTTHSNFGGTKLSYIKISTMGFFKNLELWWEGAP